MNERATSPPRSRAELEAAYAGAIEGQRFEHAARLARELGRPRDAAVLFRRAGNAFFAGIAAYEGQDKAAAVQSFVSVAPNHPLYRVACVHVVRIASEIGSLDLSVDTFLAPFLRTAPENAREGEALVQLSELYERADMLEDALHVLERVEAAGSSSPGSSQRISVLRGKLSGAPGAPPVVEAAEGESTFWRRGPVPNRPLTVPAPPRLSAPPPPPPTQPQPRPPPALAAPAVSATLVSAPQRAEAPARALSLPPPPPPPPVEADLLGDRYRIEKVLGRGGTAIVYQALDVELGERVAVKLFTDEQRDASMLQRFKQELTLSRRLAHPNVARLYDLGTHAGRRFLTMELLEGTDLRAWLKTQRPSPLTATRFARQICAGLGAAHSLGIVHRDLKPDNVFMTSSGVLKLMDFGLAKRETADDNLTVSGFFAGTPGYVAPEQITDFGTATYAADLYSFGVLFYEMLVGARPFVHKERSLVMRAHLLEAPVPPTARVPGLPAEVDAIVLRLLEKTPAARFADCGQLDQQLAWLEQMLARPAR